jgi:signal peptidase I
LQCHLPYLSQAETAPWRLAPTKLTLKTILEHNSMFRIAFFVCLAIAISGLVSIVFARCCLLIAKVTQASMLPTLQPGDRVLIVRRWPVRWLRGKRGEFAGQVVLVRPPDAQPNTSLFGFTPYIKRLVALPGDVYTIGLSDLDEFKQHQQRHLFDAQGQRTWHIPPGYCFLQGDSIYSTDSRDWGPIPLSSIVGRAILRLPRRIPSQNNT